MIKILISFIFISKVYGSDQNLNKSNETMNIELTLSIIAIIISAISIGIQFFVSRKESKEHRQNLELEYWNSLLNYELTELEEYQKLLREASNNYALMDLHSYTSDEFIKNKFLWYSFREYTKTEGIESGEAWTRFKNKYKSKKEHFENEIKEIEKKCSSYKEQIKKIIKDK